MRTEHNPEDNTVKLCRGDKKCSVISLENNKVRIDDDYGNHVLLDHAQASLIQEALILVRLKG